MSGHAEMEWIGGGYRYESTCEHWIFLGLPSLMDLCRDEAVTASNYANGLADPMLDEGLGLDDGFVRGRDVRMTAAALLYNVTGVRALEDIVNAESVCAGVRRS